MMNVIIATIKSWNIDNARKMQEKYFSRHEVKIISEKDDLNLQMLDRVKPDYIFFPHWSYIIPRDIYEKYNCVVFHMTDLPFGRGGSPLQNLIVRGIQETKISAIKVVEEIDAGPIYIKENLSLEGSAEEIYKRCSEIVFEKMIPAFFKNELKPVEQQGNPVYFKRRTAKEGELSKDMTLSQIYDHIRMLDAEGYPDSYMMFGQYKLSFKGARMQQGKIKAEVEIEEQKSE